MKDKPLSEKGHDCEELLSNVYREHDVKEAVEKLKEELKMEPYWQRICFEIDKIFGEFK